MGISYLKSKFQHITWEPKQQKKTESLKHIIKLNGRNIHTIKKF